MNTNFVCFSISSHTISYICASTSEQLNAVISIGTDLVPRFPFSLLCFLLSFGELGRNPADNVCARDIDRHVHPI